MFRPKKLLYVKFLHLKALRNIGCLLIICCQLIVVAQHPSFENLKAENNPYLQFNDITEYQHKIWFVTNEGIYQFKNNNIVEVVHKENLARFVKADHRLFVWSIYGEFYEYNNKELTSMPFNQLLTKRLQNKIINSVIYNDSTFWVSTVIGGGLIKIDQKNEEVKTLEIEAEYPYYISQFGNELISGNNSTPSKKEVAINVNNTPFYIPLAENVSFSKTNVLHLKDGSYIFTRQYEAIRFDKNKIINRVFVEKNIEGIFQDKEGKVWLILNNGGAICYADGNFKSSTSIRYLGSKTVISIYQDTRGDMWFGTSGNGIYLYRNPVRLEYKSPKIFSSTNKENEQVKSVYVLSKTPSVEENSKILRTDLPKTDTLLINRKGYGKIDPFFP